MTALVFVVACASRPTVPEAAPAEAAEATQAAPLTPTMRFGALPLPEGLDRLTAPVATTEVTVDGRSHAIDYTVLRRAEPGFGTLYDRAGEPLDELCNEQDFNSLLAVDGQPFLLSHFECTPGGLTIAPLEQGDDGSLALRGEVTSVDWSAHRGLWNPCAGQVSPWNTHLASEEYEPDGRAEPTPDAYWPHRAWNGMKRYQSEPLSPWDYGWTPEVVITDASGAHEAKKHLSPGRFSHEIAYVLPDQRTVYLSDDGYAVGWFLFVADRPADLSAGTLYAAKLAQQAREGGGSMAIEWVSLGHSTDEQIRALVDARVPFSALFDVAEPTDEACADGFTFVRHAYGEECLRLAEPSEAVPDPALAASRLETRRYAALVGATTELVKGEGVAYDEVGEQVFVAISSVKATMSDGKGHLDLDEVPCGVVYQGPVAAGVVDSEGAPIDSDHVMTQLLPAVVGRSEGKGCAADSIANPDNITFLSGYGQLVIAEDTSKHANAFLWSYDLQRGELQRLMVAPPYGEMTGVHWIPDLNGFGYLTVSVQHPWSEGIDGPLPEGITEADTRSFTGVLGPFPSLAVEAAP